MSTWLQRQLAADRRGYPTDELRSAAARELRLQARRLEALADDLEVTGSPAAEVAMDTASEIGALKVTLNTLTTATHQELR